MRLVQVEDTLLPEVLNTEYDLAIFSSGYEARCAHGPQQLECARIATPLIIGFEALTDNEQRKTNDKYFDQQWSKDRLLMAADDEGPLFARLAELNLTARPRLRILVDYSSMSRLWYAGLLTWVRLLTSVEECQIDFVYSVGKYDDNLRPIVINEILAIPGFEGGALRRGLCIAVFGLGFYGVMTQCVLEALEPDIVYAIIANPAADESYPEACGKTIESCLREQNQW